MTIRLSGAEQQIMRQIWAAGEAIARAVAACLAA